MTKRILSFLLAVVLILSLVACNQGGTEDSSEPDASSPEGTEKPAQTEKCSQHEYEQTVIKEPAEFEEGISRSVCKKCGKTLEEPIRATSSLKILAIGNSFSIDATNYLWNIAKSAGYGEVIIANLFIGGCTLEAHYENMTNDAPAYIYYKTNDEGEWVTKPDTTMLAGITDEDWDIITLQQASGSSGISGTYNYVNNIVRYVKNNRTNENSKIFWHMTWAYQGDSGHGEFAKYDGDQLKMYQGIADSVQYRILPERDIAGVIPVGTVIQNLRSSYIGDTLTRDGYHLSCEIGRYAAAMTWFTVLTGKPLDEVNFVPKKSHYKEMNFDIDTAAQAAVADAITKAIEKPFEISPMS
jgi:hypothetical protein